MTERERQEIEIMYRKVRLGYGFPSMMWIQCRVCKSVFCLPDQAKEVCNCLVKWFEKLKNDNKGLQ